MDKQKFTTELVQYATEKSTLGCFSNHGSVETTTGGAYVFSKKSSYVYCPNVPASPMVLFRNRVPDSEIRRIWKDFWTCVHEEYCKKEEYSCKLSGEDRTFNWNNGKTAIVAGDKIYVAKTEFFDFNVLKEYGFTRNDSLFVPMSNGEAYYEPAADYGCNNCGLIS